MRLKNRGRWTALIAVVAVFAAACGGSGGGSAASKADPNAKFVWSFSVGPATLDPQLGTSEYDLRMMWPVYDRLTYINEKGAVEPMLAESWNFAKDNSALTLKLRTGVTFSDGAPLTAKAVKLSLERGLTEGRSAAFQQLDKVVGSIEAVDELTVRLDLKGPAGALPFFLGVAPA